MTLISNSIGQVENVIPPQVHSLGAGFEVRRALPSAERQMVGPFIFFDATEFIPPPSEAKAR